MLFTGPLHDDWGSIDLADPCNADAWRSIIGVAPVYWLLPLPQFINGAAGYAPRIPDLACTTRAKTSRYTLAEASGPVFGYGTSTLGGTNRSTPSWFVDVADGTEMLTLPLTHYSARRSWYFRTRRFGSGSNQFGRVIDQNGMLLVSGEGSGLTDALQFIIPYSTARGAWSFTCNLSDYYEFVVTHDGSSGQPKVYNFGRSVSVTTNESPSGTPTNYAGTAYAGNRPALDRSYEGRLWELAIFDDVIPPAGALNLHCQLARNYPDLLNRTPGTRYFWYGAPSTGHTGTASLTTGGADFAATATFTPKFTATASPEIGGTTFASTAAHNDPDYTATTSLTTGGQDISASATHNDPDYTATATLTIGGADLSASATHNDPDYTGSSVLTVGGAEFTASALFGDIFSGAASLTVGGIDGTSTATFTAPTFSGEATLANSGAILSSSASHNDPDYIGSLAATIGNAEFSASASFAGNIYTANAPLLHSGVISSASATHNDPDYTATCSLIHTGVLCSATAIFGQNVFIANASLLHSGVTFAGVCVSIDIPKFRRLQIDVLADRLIINNSSRLQVEFEP